MAKNPWSVWSWDGRNHMWLEVGEGMPKADAEDSASRKIRAATKFEVVGAAFLARAKADGPPNEYPEALGVDVVPEKVVEAPERTMTITVSAAGLGDDVWRGLVAHADEIAHVHGLTTVVSETRRADDGRGHERYIAKSEG